MQNSNLHNSFLQVREETIIIQWFCSPKPFLDFARLELEDESNVRGYHMVNGHEFYLSLPATRDVTNQSHVIIAPALSFKLTN